MLYRPSVDEGGPLLAPFGFPHIHVYIRVLVCLMDGEASHEASDHRNVPRGGSGLCAPHVDLRENVVAAVPVGIALRLCFFLNVAYLAQSNCRLHGVF